MPAEASDSPHAQADSALIDALIARSPVLADPALKRHWRRLAPWLPPAARAELSDILLDVEQACRT
jgi:hypothetical protein